MAFSAFFRGLLPAFALMLSGCAEPEAEADSLPQAEFYALSGVGNFVMIVGNGGDPDKWRAMAKKQCGEESICSVYAWVDRADAPAKFPMTDRELDKQAFSYGLNRNTGYETALWDCRRFKRTSADECSAVPDVEAE